ncbi:MAG: hypothetical protein F6J93_01730 [Oscillatoria sp. SIO1A7]|nr:hypothetical protein [Oscillatoria sp. SIO1A7]
MRSPLQCDRIDGDSLRRSSLVIRAAAKLALLAIGRSRSSLATLAAPRS